MEITTRQKAQKSKYFTYQRVKELLLLDSPLHSQYQRAYECSNVIQVENGKTRTWYCNSRVCNHCNRIRTAKAINAYQDFFSLPGLSFITLTRPNVSGHNLRLEINRMKTLLYNSRRGLFGKGLMKLEVTYNSKTDSYHPHFHIVFEGDAYQLLTNWLQRSKTSNINAQDVTPVTEGVPKELLKYAFKDTAKDSHVLPPYAVDTIMRKLNGLRTYQPFGGLKKVSEEVEEQEAQKVNSSDGVYLWHHELKCWANSDGEILQ